MALALVAGCGEPLVPGQLTEEPMLSVHGTLAGFDGTPVRVAALWIDPLGERDDWPSPGDVTIGAVDAGGAFELGFLRPPTARAIRAVPSPQGGTTAFAFAFAEIVAFEDRGGGDATFQVTSRALGSRMVAPDVYRGSAGDFVVIYIDRPRTDTNNVIGELDAVLTLPRGYYLGSFHCEMSIQGYLMPVDGAAPTIVVPLVDATEAFPESRSCLRTH